MRNKKSRKSLIASLVLASSALVTLGACAGGADAGYTLPTDKQIEVGVEYTPNFALETGVTATLVDLKAPAISRSEVKDGSFTPDVTGDYELVVRFKKALEQGFKETEERLVFKVVDTTAPVFGELANKTAETGLYADLGEDILTASVKDNGAETVTVYAESIAFGNETKALGKGVEQVRLDKAGEYTVTLVAEDYSGNKSKASYKITAEDTTAPVIDIKDTAIAWVKGGKVALPAPALRDIGACAYVATVTDSAGKPVTVTDNAFTGNAGVYTVTYTAKDDANNESQAQVKLIVKEEGVFADFTIEGEERVFDCETSRLSDNKLKLYTTVSNSVSFELSSAMPETDWSGYTSFEFDVENTGGVFASVQAEFLVNGAWQKTAPVILSAKASQKVAIYLSDYSLSKVDGFRVTSISASAPSISVDNIKLSKVADTREKPSQASYLLKAGGGTEITLTGASAKNAVTYQIYSYSACQIKTGLRYADGIVYSMTSLKAGWNTIVRFPYAESDDTVSGAPQSLVLINPENYDYTVHTGAVAYADSYAIQIADYTDNAGNYSVAYGTEFAVPNPFTVGPAWYRDLTITLYKGSSKVQSDMNFGDVIKTVGTGAYKAGTYTLKYSYTDVNGATQTLSRDVVLEPNYLTVSFETKALFTSDSGVELPQAALSSTQYTATNLKDAKVETYYRIKGRKVWEKLGAGEPFMARENTWYQIRYTAEYDGHYAETQFEKFIHVNNYTLDFEPEDAVGEKDLIYRDADNNVLFGKSRFLYDGGYYNYITSSTDNRFEVYNGWSKSGEYSLMALSPHMGGMAYGLYIRTEEGDKAALDKHGIKKNAPVNAITFWAYADSKTTVIMELARGGQWGGKWTCAEDFELLAGEHFYTVYLEEEFTAEEQIGIFYIGMVQQGVRICFDDISFVYVNRVNAEDTNDYLDQIDHTNGYELTAPKLTSDLLTLEELAKANIVLTYTFEGKEYELQPDSNGKYVLRLDHGGYVKFKWQVSYDNIWTEGDLTDKFEWTFESNDVLINIVRLENEHAEVVEIGDELKLDAPTTSEGEMSNLVLNYRVKGTENWITVEPNADGKYELPTSAKGWLEIKFVCDVQVREDLSVKGWYDTEIYVRDPAVFLDFEGSDPFRGGAAHFNTAGQGKFDGSELVTYDETGSYAQKFLMNEDSWDGVYYASIKDLGSTYNSIKLRIYAGQAVENYVILLKDDKIEQEIKVNLNAGWNDVFVEISEVSKVRYLVGKISKKGDLPTIMWDDIYFTNVNYEGDVPKSILLEEQFTFPKATIDHITATISWRKVGATEWTTLEGGKVTPTELGDYEVRYAFGTIMEKVFTVKVTYPINYAGTVPTEGKVNTQITLPSATAGSLTATVMYRKFGAETWTTGNAFTPTSAGTYQVCYRFEGLEDTIFNIAVRDPAVFLDFEGSDPFKGGDDYFRLTNPNDASADKTGFIVELEDGTHALQFTQLWTTGGWWDGVAYHASQNVKDLGGSYTKMSMKIYSPVAVEAYYVYFLFDGGVFEKKFALTEGWQTVTFELGKTVSKMAYMSMNMKPNYGGMMWDDIKFYN